MTMPIKGASSRILLGIALAAALLLPVACSPGGGGDPPAPTVVATVPIDGAAAVPVGTNVTVTFSRAMNAVSAQAAFSSVPPIACAFAWNGAGTALTCNPVADLAPGTLHTITIDGAATSAAGVALGADYVFEFTTAVAVLEDCRFGTGRFGACRFGP
jgi:hypothetical protein